MCPNNIKNDLSICAPPYFDMEIYPSGNEQDTQSHQRYPTFNRWLTDFFYNLLHINYRAIRLGGYLAMNVGEVKTNSVTEEDDKNRHRCSGKRLYNLPALFTYKMLELRSMWKAVAVFDYAPHTKRSPSTSNNKIYIYQSVSELSPMKELPLPVS